MRGGWGQLPGQWVVVNGRRRREGRLEMTRVTPHGTLPRIQAQWIPIEHSSGHFPCCRGHTGSWRYRWDPVSTQVSEAWDVQPLRSPACLPPSVLSWEGCRARNRDDCDRGRSQRGRGRRNGAAALKTGRLTLNFKTLLFFLQWKQRGIY